MILKIIIIFFLFHVFKVIGLESHLIKCNNNDNNKYNNRLKDYSEDLTWCTNKMKTFPIEIGKSFGGMNANDRKKWVQISCPGLTSIGRPYSCSETVGSEFIKLWKNRMKIALSSSNNNKDSQVNCYTANKANVVCRFEKIMIDFSKIIQKSNSRTFQKGFITIYGNKESSSSIIPEALNGLSIIPSNKKNDNNNNNHDNRCD